MQHQQQQSPKQDDGQKLDHEFLDAGEIQAEKNSTQRNVVGDVPNMEKEADTIVLSAPLASSIEDAPGAHQNCEQEDYDDNLRSLPETNDQRNSQIDNGQVVAALTEKTNSDVRQANQSQIAINVESSIVPVSVLSMANTNNNFEQQQQQNQTSQQQRQQQQRSIIAMDHLSESAANQNDGSRHHDDTQTTWQPSNAMLNRQYLACPGDSNTESPRNNRKGSVADPATRPLLIDQHDDAHDQFVSGADAPNKLASQKNTVATDIVSEVPMINKESQQDALDDYIVVDQMENMRQNANKTTYGEKTKMSPNMEEHDQKDQLSELLITENNNNNKRMSRNIESETATPINKSTVSAEVAPHLTRSVGEDQHQNQQNQQIVQPPNIQKIDSVHSTSEPPQPGNQHKQRSSTNEQLPANEPELAGGYFEKKQSRDTRISVASSNAQKSGNTVTQGGGSVVGRISQQKARRGVSQHQPSMVSSTMGGSSPNKRTLHQKKVVFYPDMARVSKDDPLLYQFFQKDYGDPFEGKEIDPDEMKYQCPDFGFDNNLIFEEKNQIGHYSANWKFFMDYASIFPRFERLANYIQFIKTQKEYEETMKSLGGRGRMERQGSIIGKLRQVKNMKPNEQYEILHKLKADIMKNNNANVNPVQRQDLDPQQVKYAELGVELDKLNMELRKKTAFVKHIKKLDEKNQAEYAEEIGEQRRKSTISTKKPNSPSKYNSPESPSVHRGSLISKRETFKGFKKLDMMNRSRYSSLSPENRQSSITESPSPQCRKPVPPIVKKKAVFREYTQSRDQIDIGTGISSAGSRFIMPLTTSNSRRGAAGGVGGSMYLTTEAEVKIEEDSDHDPAASHSAAALKHQQAFSKQREEPPLPQFRIKKQGGRSQKRSKQHRNQAGNLIRRSQNVSSSRISNGNLTLGGIENGSSSLVDDYFQQSVTAANNHGQTNDDFLARVLHPQFNLNKLRSTQMQKFLTQNRPKDQQHFHPASTSTAASRLKTEHNQTTTFGSGSKTNFNSTSQRRQYDSANVSQEGGAAIMDETATASMNLDIQAETEKGFIANDGEGRNALRTGSLDAKLPSVLKNQQQCNKTASETKSQLSKIHSDKEALKKELLQLKEQRLRAVKPTSILQEQEAFRAQLISKLEKGIANLQTANKLSSASSEDSNDVILGKQALLFLQQNRTSRVDTSRHLNILLNCEAFPAPEIAENAKLLLKFVKLSERINNEAEKLRSGGNHPQQKEMPRLRQGMKTAMSVKGYYGIPTTTGTSTTNPNTTFTQHDHNMMMEMTGSQPLSPASSAAHISQIYNRPDLGGSHVKTTGHKSQLSHHHHNQPRTKGGALSSFLPSVVTTRPPNQPQQQQQEQFHQSFQSSTRGGDETCCQSSTDQQLSTSFNQNHNHNHHPQQSNSNYDNTQLPFKEQEQSCGGKQQFKAANMLLPGSKKKQKKSSGGDTTVTSQLKSVKEDDPSTSQVDLQMTNIEVKNSQMFHQDSSCQVISASGQTVGPPLSGGLAASRNKEAGQQQHLKTDSSSVEREYFDEIYQMKQVAARRKLAYENNRIGRVNNNKQRKSAASSKDWSKTKSICRNRNRLALSMTSKPDDQDMQQPRLNNL